MLQSMGLQIEKTERLNLIELGQVLLKDQISEEVNNTLNLVIKFFFFFLTFSRVMCVCVSSSVMSDSLLSCGL